MDNQQFPYPLPSDPDQNSSSQQERGGEDASYNEPANQGNATQPENQYWQNPAETQAINQSQQIDLPPPDTVNFQDNPPVSQASEQNPSSSPKDDNTTDTVQDNQPLEIPQIPPDNQFQTSAVDSDEEAPQPVNNGVQQPEPPQPPQPEPVESMPQEEQPQQESSDTQQTPPMPQAQPPQPNEQTQEAPQFPSSEQQPIPQPPTEEQNIKAPRPTTESSYGQETNIPDQTAPEPPQDNAGDSPQIYTFKRRSTIRPVTDAEEQTSQKATHSELQEPYPAQRPAAENVAGDASQPEPVQPEEQPHQAPPQQQLPPESTPDTPVPTPASSGQSSSEQPAEMPPEPPLTTETDQQRPAVPAEQTQQETMHQSPTPEAQSQQLPPRPSANEQSQNQPQQFPQFQTTDENAGQQSGQHPVAANGSNDKTPANTAATFPLPNNQPQPAAADQNEPLQAIPPEQPEATSGQSEKDETITSKTLHALGKIKKINFKPAVSAALTGILILGIFNSQAILGQVQYLTTPSGGREAPSGSIDANAPVGDESRILIPQLDVNVPVVYDEKSFKEEKVQKALERGVVHYGTTAMPGENGNNVIVGHSSNNWWDSGKYKFAFILLDKLQKGDEIILHYEGTRYVYEVHNKKVVQPTNTEVLKQTEDPILTLITCTPPGTSWKRLIVQAEQVTPDPSQNSEPETSPSENAEALPSDSGRSLFEFIGDLF